MTGFSRTAYFNRPEKRRDYEREKTQGYIANDSSLNFAYKPETDRAK